MIVRLDEVEARQKEMDAAHAKAEKDKEVARAKAEEERLRAERERLEAMHRQQIELERQKRKQELDAALASLKAQYAAIDAALDVNAAIVPPSPPPLSNEQPIAPAQPSLKAPLNLIQQTENTPQKNERKSFGPVKQGESLASIISRYDEFSKFSSDDVAATFVRLNPSAFKNKKSSKMLSGVMLTVPLPPDVLETTSQRASISTTQPAPKAAPPKKTPAVDAEVVEKTIPNALAMPAPQVKVQDQPIPQENLIIEPLKKAAPISDVPVKTTSAPPQVQTDSAPKSQSDARAQLLSEAQEIRRLIEEAKAAAKSGAAQ